MTRTIPDTTITKIRQAADIVEIVSESVPLRKAGKDFSGLCPFHAEKTPSFSVSPDKQLFYCFGCGEGGDVFHYLMRRDGLSFGETVRLLARRFGIEIEDREMTAEEREAGRRREQLLWIHREAEEWFRKALGGEDAEAARRYLDRRGLSPEVRETFGLGFAPDAWTRLLDHLAGRGVPAEDVERAGLALPRKSGDGHYDRFRNRIIFPIPDGQGRVVAFGGRVLDDQKPKYLNSPETDLFSKRNALYGYPQARRSARDAGRVFVVEGYLDAIALHQFGIPNAVATLGTALTPDHVRLLHSMTERAMLVFDADEAGRRAAEKSVPLFVRAQMPASVLLLAPGKDPDDFLREEGADAFARRAERAPDGVPFLADRLLERHGDDVAGKAKAAAELAPVLAAVRDPVARPLYVAEVARRIGVPEAAIRERMGADRPPAPPTAVRPETAEPFGRKNDRPETSRKSVSGRWRLERLIATMVLDYPPARPLAKESGIAEELEDERLRAILEVALDRPELGADELSAELTDPAARRLAASLVIEHGDASGWTPTACKNLIAQMKGHRPRRPDPLLARIEEARRNDDPERLQRLLREKMKNSQARKGCRQPDERTQEAQSDG